MTTKTAAQLEPGDVIVKVGRTTYRPITVTAVRVLDLYSGDLIVVTGFTASNPEPRLMFRGLAAALPVTVQDATPPATALETARAALAAHDDPSIILIGADGFPLIGSVERAEYIIEALRPLAEATTTERECDRCGDHVQTLSSQDLCDGCIEENAAGPAN